MALSVPCSAQEVSGDGSNQSEETLAPTDSPAQTRGSQNEPGIESPDPEVGAISEDLKEIRTALERIEDEVRRPTLIEKLKDDFVSNAIWTMLTSTESEGNLFRRISSVLGFVFLCVKIWFWARRKVKREQLSVSLPESFANVGLFAATLIMTFIFGGAQLTNGLHVKAGANLTRVEKRLSQLERLNELDAIEASVEGLRGTIEGLSSCVGAAPGGEGHGLNIGELDLMLELAKKNSDDTQALLSQLGQTRRSIESIESDMATDGFQALNTIMLFLLLFVMIAGLLVWFQIMSNSPR